MGKWQTKQEEANIRKEIDDKQMKRDAKRRKWVGGTLGQMDERWQTAGPQNKSASVQITFLVAAVMANVLNHGYDGKFAVWVEWIEKEIERFGAGRSRGVDQWSHTGTPRDVWPTNSSSKRLCIRCHGLNDKCACLSYGRLEIGD